MATTIKTTHRSLVALSRPNSVPALIVYAQGSWSEWPAHSASRVEVYLAGFASEHLLTGRRPRQLEEDVGFAIIARIDPFRLIE